LNDTLARLRSALAERYRIERELGRGGMAIVYLATDLKHDRAVALKVLRPELASALGPERFLREIQTVARLSHPHILPLFDSGEADGLLYYVMPFMAGESLRDRLDREGPLGLEETLRIAAQVVEALGRAHQGGVIHRDVKPANILFEAGQALVSDFGIARAVDAAGGERMTQTGMAVGTPAYMSPEQATGSAADARSDVYSLACIVYEMLVGEPPFTGATPRAVLARHATDEARPVSELRPDVPASVGRTLDRALAKDPADRYATATDFGAALAEANTTAAIEREARRRRRGRAARVAAAAAVLAGLGAGGWWLARTLGGPPIERLAVLPLANLTNDPEEDYLVAGVHDALINELAQSGIAVIARQSVLRYASTEQPIREIAAELDLDAVIEGSVMPRGDSVDVTLRLVDARSEEPLWSGRFDRPLRDIAALYRDVSGVMVDRIGGHAPVSSAGSTREMDPEAYRAYLQGLFFWGRLTPDNIDNAERYFESALEIDPGFALAHAGIARVWIVRLILGLSGPEEAGPRAWAAVRRALAADSTLAEVQEVLAGVQLYVDRDREAAGPTFRRALELNPNGAELLTAYSNYLDLAGRHEEALAEIERALALDPNNPQTRFFYGRALMEAHRFDEAVEQYRGVLALVPDHSVTHSMLWATYHMQGLEEQALEEALTFFSIRSPELADDMRSAAARGRARAGYAGALVEIARLMTERAESAYMSPMHIARLYAYTGENDSAFAWLERAVDAGEPNAMSLGVRPDFEALHEDPRFENFLERHGLATSPDTAR